MKIMSGLAAAAACLSLPAACSDGEPPAAAPARSASAPATPAPSETITPSKRWRDLFGAVELKGASGLVDVLAKGPKDAWAAGFEDGAEDEYGVPVLAHWSGSAWTRVPVENSDLRVRAFDVAGRDDIWLVGGSGVVSHWDGRVWTEQRPFGVAEDYWPNDVAAAKGHAVIVGSSAGGGFGLEWDGTKFELIQQVDGVFTSVALDDGHVWAVGSRPHGGCQDVKPTVAHRSPDEGWLYDQDMSLPDIPGGHLHSVLAIKPDDVWVAGAVGGDDRYEDLPARCAPPSEDKIAAETPEPLVMHWNGSAWRRMELPPWKGSLRHLTAFGKDDVWASGTDPLHPGRAILLHYDGTSWTREAISAGRTGNAAIAAVPGTSDLWGVGSIGEGTDYEQPFIVKRH
ncbi:hypothetical protein ACIBI9_36825 [Nonomuraea sp. NPDC050451]|uniref:hypothetical protein n=1 Tax=Nonomuraea sp. NPDC050451 TaxID=3364364 RepID=UPI003792BB9E